VFRRWAGAGTYTIAAPVAARLSASKATFEHSGQRHGETTESRKARHSGCHGQNEVAGWATGEVAMQGYDVALKLLLRHLSELAMRDLAGSAVGAWLETELPAVENLRMDSLGKAADGSLVHLELQSTNKASMPIRMAKYALEVFRKYKQFPRQTMIYVGEAPLKMEDELRGPDLWFRYRALDIRELDGERLLKRDAVGDNILALLAGCSDNRTAVRTTLEKIARLPAGEREAVLGLLMILSGLRHLEETVEQEALKMPILNIENKVLGREFERGLEEGKQQGREEGELKVLRRQIEKRFGPLPDWAEKWLASRSASELEELSIRVLDAETLEELLKN